MGELNEVKVHLSEEGSNTLYSQKAITSPDDAVEVMSDLLGKQDREFFCAVNLDIKNRPINYHVITVGSLNKSLVDIGNTFKTALLSNAAKVMIFHNHPSGDLIPSYDDIAVTKKIVNAGQILGIEVLDHVIVGGRNRNYYSIYKSDPALFAYNEDDSRTIVNSIQESNVRKYNAGSKKDEFRKAIAEQFVKLLDSDNDTNDMDWIKEWNSASSIPINTLNGNRYRGINKICLFLTANEKGYKDPRWATIATINKIPGARVKKGEHGTKVEYWFVRDFGLENDDPGYGKSYTFDQAADLVKTKGRSWSEFTPYPRYYTVFNAEQCSGVPPLALTENNDVQQDELVSVISHSMQVDIKNDGGDQAYYRPSEDIVHLPDPGAFVSSYAYNATALHELAHSTGASHRLNRNISGLFGSEDYAFEELVAEMTSCMVSTNFVMNDSGVDEYLKDHAENHKRYVKSWAKAIKSNPSCLVQAIKCAELATDFLELHGGLMDISTFNKHHGHDVTVVFGNDNQIRISYLKPLSNNTANILESQTPQMELQQKGHNQQL